MNGTNNETYKLGTAVPEDTETLSGLTSATPNNTQYVNKSIKKNVLYILLGCIGVILILLVGLYAICQIIKRFVVSSFISNDLSQLNLFNQECLIRAAFKSVCFVTKYLFNGLVTNLSFK